MSDVQKLNENKWQNVAVVAAAIVIGYVSYAFFNQLGEWFELEAKIPRFNIFAQGLGVVLAAIFFIAVQKIPASSKFLSETFHELSKVIWPDRQETVRQTIGIMIGLAILGIVLGLIDVGIGKLLGLLHS